MELNELKLEVLDLNQQAAMLIKVGKVQEAKAKLEKAADLDPMVVDTYRNYGDLYMAVEQYKDAKNAYKKALLVEKSGVLYFLYGNACFMNDDVHEGLENYNNAISAGYDSDEMMFFMGMAYEHLNDDNMALRYFQKASLKNPSRPDYMVKKISVMVRLGMMESAEKETDVLLNVAPELYDGYHIKIQLLMQRGDMKEAVTFAKAATERFPEDAELMYDYVKCMALAKDYDNAIRVLNQAKQMKYFDAVKTGFMILEAQIAAENNNFDYAIQCCEECIAIAQDGEHAGEAGFILMNLYFVQENYDNALKQASALVAKETGDPYYHAALYYKALCLKRLGKAEESGFAYKNANAIYRLHTLQNPAAIDVYLYRSMCLKDMEEYDKALEMLDFILGLDDQIAEVYTIKAEIYNALGKKAQADAQLEKAYAIKPELKPQDGKDGE